MLGPKLPIVAICVGRGEDTTLFGIHQNILEHCSPFFQALLNEDIPIGIKTEMETRPVSEIRFEGDIEAFEVYTEWVYSGRVFKKKLRDDEGSAKFLSYGQAYILGEKLLNHDFKNEVLDTLLTEILSGGKIDLTLATLVYEGTAKTSPLRRLLVDIYTWYGHKDWLRYGNNKSHPPPSFCQTSLPLFSSVTITTQPSKTDILSGTHAGTTNIPLDKIAQHLITEAILES
ncbi:hypothetical protein D6C86_07158 [Aureobasidium pullulans]|nr:hypothetical protein D6C86_07158 [Aureobasidium pullulans]